MPRVGVEPTRPCDQWFLRPYCIPVSAPWLPSSYYTLNFEAKQVRICSMKYKLATEVQFSATGVLVLPIFENDSSGQVSEIVKVYLKENPKFGKKFDCEFLYSTTEKILLVGVGKREKFDFETCQNFAGIAVKSLLNKTTEIILIIPDVPFKKVEAVILGIEIAVFNTAEKYKSEKQEVKLEDVQIVVGKTQNGYMDELKKAQIVAESINLARTLGDMPSNEMTPAYFLKEAVSAFHVETELSLCEDETVSEMDSGDEGVGVSSLDIE